MHCPDNFQIIFLIQCIQSATLRCDGWRVNLRALWLASWAHLWALTIKGPLAASFLYYSIFSLAGHVHHPADFHPVLACSLWGVLAPNAGKALDIRPFWSEMKPKSVQTHFNVFFFLSLEGCKEAVPSVQHHHLTGGPEASVPVMPPLSSSGEGPASLQPIRDGLVGSWPVVDSHLPPPTPPPRLP